jgi:hypothetical protein
MKICDFLRSAILMKHNFLVNKFLACSQLFFTKSPANFQSLQMADVLRLRQRPFEGIEKLAGLFFTNKL